MHNKILLFLVLALLLNPDSLRSQQVPDTANLPSINNPVYKAKAGPVICIDAAHNNLHTLDRGYAPFGAFLKKDGYRLKSVNNTFEKDIPEGCTILVIANALHKSNLGNWVLPTPSAFTDQEIRKIKDWVADGGSLFLIADHMPYPGANEKLAAAFGFTFNNGFAMKQNQTWPPAIFTKSDNTLKGSPVTQEIDSVSTYTGQAFKIPEKAIPVIEFGNDHYTLMPDTAWRFNANTPQHSVKGWSQGAIMPYGNGKLAVFGEAAMFTAQVIESDDLKVGIIDPNAPQNAAFLLSIIHWLDPELK